MAPTLQMRLLGTFSLVYGAEPVTGVNSPRPQSLLAYLVMHRDAPQSRQHLAFLFWPDSSEAQARNNLRQTLHVLRQALPNAGAFLYADTNTLRWRPDAPFSLDVAEFERALTLAEAAEQQMHNGAPHAALEQAANLYEADLLPSCYDDWITPERERLRRRYLRALGQLIELLDAQQDYASAIEYARRMIAHDALNEDACRHLMRLLPLKGDRAGALRAYHAYAGALERELGIAPGQEIAEAYERLLRTDGVPSPAQAQRHALSATPTIIGREHEWERLHEEWRSAAAAGRPGFVLVTGEAGIGKSRLGEEMLLWADQHGAVTAKTRCYAAEGRLSLAPVTEWLRSDGLRPHLARLDRVWLTEVSRILPELASEHRDLPPYQPISEYGQRRRFFEALARAVLAAPQPLMLLIDDLQWCDQETLEWLHFLLRFDPTARLLIIGSARSEELAAEHPLRTLLLNLHHTAGITEIPLPPLDAAETARLAAALDARELNVALAMRLYRETEGNPLFVVETMRAGFDGPGARREAAADGAERTPSHEESALPPLVRAVIAARLAQLSPPAREVALLAATIGRAFRLDVLVRANAIGEDDLMRALDELWRRRIVREQGANTYDFTHDKLREVAYGETSAPQRRLRHRRIAQALEAVHAGDLDPVSGQIASHLERAGLHAEAIPYFERAAAVARRVYANEDAIGYLVRALDLLELLPAGTTRDAEELRLLLALAPIYRVTRGWTAPELERVMSRAMTLCDTVGDGTQRQEALYGWQSLLMVQAKMEQVLMVADELKALYERSQRTPPPLSGMMVAGMRLHQGHAVEANAMFEHMVGAPSPRYSGDPQDTLGWNLAVHARAWRAHTLWYLGYPERALSLGLEAIQIARDLVLPFNQALASAYFAMLQQMRADAATFTACAEEALALTIEYKAPYYQAWASILVRSAHAWERPDETHLAELRASIEGFKATGARLRLPYYLWLLAFAHRKAGRIEEGLATVDEALAASGAHNERWWDAELYRLRAELKQTIGDNEEDVEATLLQAAALARDLSARSLELRAATSLARWLRERNRDDDARRRLGEVYDRFTEGFATPDLLEARSLLEQLA